MLSVVIPTLNEEKTIAKVIEAIPRDLLKKLGFDVEVLVVDGGSKDKTVERALSRGARVIIVRRRGYGLAYIMGFKYVRGDLIVTLDADLTYPPEEIPKLLKIMEKLGVDFISTNRFADFEEGAFNKVRLLGNKLINLLVFILFGVKIKDTQSGMWFFKKTALKKIRPMSFGMEFSTEIKLEAIRKVKFFEAPIKYKKRGGGASKINYLRDGFRIAMFLIKYRILTLFRIR